MQTVIASRALQPAGPPGREGQYIDPGHSRGIAGARGYKPWGSGTRVLGYSAYSPCNHCNWGQRGQSRLDTSQRPAQRAQSPQCRRAPWCAGRGVVLDQIPSNANAPPERSAQHGASNNPNNGHLRRPRRIVFLQEACGV